MRRAVNPRRFQTRNSPYGIDEPLRGDHGRPLTNIVLARRDLEREEDRGVRAQFTGGLEAEPLARDDKPQTTPSLQVSNFENVDILAGSFKQFGSADFSKADNRLDPVTHDIDTHIENNLDKKGEFTRERSITSIPCAMNTNSRMWIIPIPMLAMIRPRIRH